MEMRVCTEICAGALDGAGIGVIAQVLEANCATDIAATLTTGRLAVIRCVTRASATDHAALATMLTDGDFAWAGIIFSEWEGSEPVGLIEAFHVSELDRLVARLTKLREVFDGST